MTKKQKISATLKQTREKRKHQVCKVFELKVDKSHLSKKTLNEIKLDFLEAKWLSNHALSQNIFEVSDKLKEVQIKVKDVFEKREIKTLGSQMRQSILEGMCQDIKNLSKKKNKGQKVGALKFKSECNCIDLKQYGHTYKIKGDKIKIQGIKQWFRASGCNQLKGYEFANAKFIHNGGDYFFHIICYKNIDLETEKQKQEESKPFNPISLDFGIASQITLSNAVKINYLIEPTDRLKKLCQEFSRKKSYSKNWYKAKDLLTREYEKINNQKGDIKNKLLHILKDEYSHIFFQNDCMQGWQRIWGKRMMNTAIGGIIADLRKLEKKSATAVGVDRFFPSTKRCSECHHKQKVELNERIFICKQCGFTCSRDLNSTFNIEQEAKIKLKKLGVEYTEATPAERSASVKFLDRLNAIPRVVASTLVETGSPTVNG